jgi:hypothetical protein
MAGLKTLNLSRKNLGSPVSAFSLCVARTTAQRRPGLTSGPGVAGLQRPGVPGAAACRDRMSGREDPGKGAGWTRRRHRRALNARAISRA